MYTEIAKRAIDAFNKRDFAVMQESAAEDVILTTPFGTRYGKETLSFFKGWTDAFPDCTVTVNKFIEQGDSLVVYGTFKGTHTGTFHTPQGDFSPTGRVLKGDYFVLYTFRGQKVASEYMIFDRLDVLEQLGLLPQLATV